MPCKNYPPFHTDQNFFWKDKNIITHNFSQKRITKSKVPVVLAEKHESLQDQEWETL